MNSISRLLNPRSLAVVGASPRGGRGGRTLANLRETGFKGATYAVNARYEEVLGYACYPSLDELPASVDCLVIAIGAEAACDVLEHAFARDIRAAVLLAAGFGEGGQNESRAERIRVLGEKGMSICGPNCYGLLSVKAHATVAAFSGKLPKPLVSGDVALISQSGGLTNNVFTPLMSDRRLGFRYVVSCGNQIATTIEDYIEAFVDDADVRIIAAVIESIKNPRKLSRIARMAHTRGKVLIFYQIGRSHAGKMMVQSHTGALVGNSEALSAFLRRCGVISVDGFEEFVEAVEFFAIAPRGRNVSREVIVISGSGGGAAVAADALEGTGMSLPIFEKPTQDRIRAILPEFGNVTNPLDGTGSMSDDPRVLENALGVLLTESSRAIIATTITARQVASAKEHRFTEIVSQAAQSSDRVLVAFQHSSLGGPLDLKIVETLHSARVPLLLGGTAAMRVLRYLPLAEDYRREVLSRDWRQIEHAEDSEGEASWRPTQWNFLTAREALTQSGVMVVEAAVAASEREAVSGFRQFGGPVALKIEADGLLHKSDIGCVCLNCVNEAEVVAGYRAILANARQAGVATTASVLVQPMVAGVAEVFAGVIMDPTFGPAVCLGLGGIFVEIFKDVVTEMAPVTHDDALKMIRRLKGAPILLGARGRPASDIESLAEFLVHLGEFALTHAGCFRTIDLNPVIVKRAGQGVVAVDIAVEPSVNGPTSPPKLSRP